MRNKIQSTANPAILFFKVKMNIKLLFQYLEQEGVIIDNQEECTKALAHFGLSRLLPYTKIMDKWPLFSEVMKIYYFDREIRMQIWLLIEILEIDIKTKLVEETTDIDRKADKLSGTYINDTQAMENLLTEIIEKHKEKISSCANPAPTRKTTNFWKMILFCSFWDLGLIFKYLNDLKKVNIVSHYHLPMKKSIQTFSSWLSALRKIRNMWAHHEMCITNPTYLRLSPRASVTGSAKLFIQLEVLLFLCMQIDRPRAEKIREMIIKHLGKGINSLECDILQIIWAPQDRERVLHSL